MTITNGRESILKAAMHAGCDEADRLGYGGTLGYVEAASIAEKAALNVLDSFEGAVVLTGPELNRVLWWLHKPVPPGPAKELDETIIRKLEANRVPS